MKFAPDLEALFQASVQGKSLTELVDLALSINPGIALVAPSLSAERISAALRGGDLHTSPLVRRDGQRFLREFRDAVLARGVPSGG